MTVAERAAAAHARLLAEPVDLSVGDPGPERMFDDAVYKRGALALVALQRAAGEENFLALLRRWVAENRHGSVSTTAFLAMADEVCAGVPGFSANSYLAPWLYERDLPALPLSSV